MRLGAIHYYVGLISVLGLVSLQLVPWGELGSLTLEHLVGFCLLVGFGLLSERLSVGMSLVPRGAGHTITFIPLLAAILLFGPGAPVLLMAITGGTAEVLIRRKEAIRAIFNLGQYLLATSVAGWAFATTGGVGSVGQSGFPLQLVPFFTFLVVFMGINHGAVCLAIAISEAQPFHRVWRKFIGPSGVNAAHDLLAAPLAIVVAFFYWQAGWVGLVLSLFPLLFIRHAYLNAYRLELANRDLLKALVKAIETRDPYTSGHSQRVSALAGRIARELGVSARKVEAIEMAALLHDVGKIDAIYTELLRKPHALSADEWRVMESHVTKGVEVLQSLTSVPVEVVAAVRHHHEREDGRGYPDRLHGYQIPTGAKIIKVCDAIDAMLSDRPYRAALSVDKVKEELREYAGRQFDVEVVNCVLSSTVLEEHVEALRASKAIVSEAPQRTSVNLPLVGRRPTPRSLAVS